MKKYFIGICILVLVGICCIILFNNNKENNNNVITVENDNYTLLPTDISNINTTIKEEQSGEEIIEPEIKVISDNRIETSNKEFVVNFSKIIELELEKAYEVSLDSYERPYNHTIREEDFMKMSPEDQDKVINDVYIEAKEIKSSVIECYQEVQNLIKIQSYSLAEEKVLSLLKQSIDYDGGDESISFCQIMSLSFQRELLAIMKQIYDVTDRLDEKILVDKHIQEINDRTLMLQERQNMFYGENK